MSLFSGIVFTTNNFVVNRVRVCVVDAVLVRWLLQLAVTSLLLCWRREPPLGPDWPTTALAITQVSNRSIGVDPRTRW